MRLRYRMTCCCQARLLSQAQKWWTPRFAHWLLEQWHSCALLSCVRKRAHFVSRNQVARSQQIENTAYSHERNESACLLWGGWVNNNGGSGWEALRDADAALAQGNTAAALRAHLALLGVVRRPAALKVRGKGLVHVLQPMRRAPHCLPANVDEQPTCYTRVGDDCIYCNGLSNMLTSDVST